MYGRMAVASSHRVDTLHRKDAVGACNTALFSPKAGPEHAGTGLGGERVGDGMDLGGERAETQRITLDSPRAASV